MAQLDRPDGDLEKSPIVGSYISYDTKGGMRSLFLLFIHLNFMLETRIAA